MDAKAVPRTRICRRIGFDSPIVQAEMGLAADAELTAAVPNAGALGCAGAGTMSTAELKEQIRLCPHPDRMAICCGYPVGRS